MSDRGEGLGALTVGMAVKRGLPRLASLILGEVAGYGGDYFRTDVSLQADIFAKSGWKPHRESIGRSRRQLASRWGVTKNTRIRTGQRPSPHADHPSAHGCARTELIWSALGMRTPARSIRKRERARARERARQTIAPPKPQTAPERVDLVPGPKHSTPAPAPPSTAPGSNSSALAADLAIAQIRAIGGRMGERIEAREDEAAVLSAERARKARPPPDTS